MNKTITIETTGIEENEICQTDCHLAKVKWLSRFEDSWFAGLKRHYVIGQIVEFIEQNAICGHRLGNTFIQVAKEDLNRDLTAEMRAAGIIPTHRV